MNGIELSVVAPVFNEQEGIGEFYRRLDAVLKELRIDYEVIFVDDGSKDRSAQILRGICETDRHVRLLRFTRNFGHQLAIKAGIDHAQGRAVITMDADLQDPPEVIPGMLERWREGHDVVYAVRAEREGETAFKKLTAAGFYRLLRALSSVDLPVDTGDFRLISRRVADIIRSVSEKQPYIRGWAAWAAERPVALRIHRQARFAGTTKYSLGKMLRLAASGFIQFSRFNRSLSRSRQAGAGVPRPHYELLSADAR